MTTYFTRVGRLRRATEVNSQEIISEVNLTPLVDMALTLIVVFLIFLPALTTLIPISSTSSGSSSQGNSEENEEPLVISLSTDKIRLGSQEFASFEKLVPWMRDFYIKRKNHQVTVRTEPNVDQQRLVTLLDYVRQCGDWKVSLSVLKESNP